MKTIQEILNYCETMRQANAKSEQEWNATNPTSDHVMYRRGRHHAFRDVWLFIGSADCSKEAIAKAVDSRGMASLEKQIDAEANAPQTARVPIFEHQYIIATDAIWCRVSCDGYDQKIFVMNKIVKANEP